MKQKLLALGIALAGGLGNSLPANAGDFEVTITNLTRGQQFTPVLVASHKAGVKLFELGQPASPELATLDETGEYSTARQPAHGDARGFGGHQLQRPAQSRSICDSDS